MDLSRQKMTWDGTNADHRPQCCQQITERVHRNGHPMNWGRKVANQQQRLLLSPVRQLSSYTIC
jgi:hypothetical protein